MIVWVSGESVRMPVDQRAQVLNVLSDGRSVRVKLLGTLREKDVDWTALCGVELDGGMTISFKAESVRVIR